MHINLFHSILCITVNVYSNIISIVYTYIYIYATLEWESLQIVPSTLSDLSLLMCYIIKCLCYGIQQNRYKNLNQVMKNHAKISPWNNDRRERVKERCEMFGSRKEHLCFKH